MKELADTAMFYEVMKTCCRDKVKLKPVQSMNLFKSITTDLMRFLVKFIQVVQINTLII